MRVVHTFRHDEQQYVVVKALVGGAYVFTLLCDGVEMSQLPTEFADIVSDIAYSGNDPEPIVAAEFESLIRSAR